MRNRYRDNVGYLFKRIKDDNTISYQQIGQGFQYNKEQKKRGMIIPQTGVFMSARDEIIKTTAQLNFPTCFLQWVSRLKPAWAPCDSQWADKTP